MTRTGSPRLSEALTEHYARYGLPPDGGESATTFVVHIGPLDLRLPNPPARRRAVFFHDVNHIATGYNNIFSDGEMVIAGFEIGAGCGPFVMAWLINLGMLALGLTTVPGKLFRAFIRGRRSRSIYERCEDRRTLANMSVAEIRHLMQLDSRPASPGAADVAAFIAWAVAGVAVLSSPLILVGLLVAILR